MAVKVHLRFANAAAFILFVVGVSGLCPNAWEEHGASCYKIDSDVARSWDEGAEYCRQLGAELLVIETPEENEFLLGILKGRSLEWVWLGCSDRSTEGRWLCYKDASGGLPFENWATNEPNNNMGDDDCMSFHTKNGKWFDSKCYKGTVEVYTVCENRNTQGTGEGDASSPSVAPMTCYTLGPDGRLPM